MVKDKEECGSKVETVIDEKEPYKVLIFYHVSVALETVLILDMAHHRITSN